MKTKLQLGTGRSCTKFWDDKGKRLTEIPDDWFDSSFKANLCVRHLYVMPKEVGCVIEVRDLRCKTTFSANPFGDETEQGIARRVGAGVRVNWGDKKWYLGTKRKIEFAQLFWVAHDLG